MVLVLTFVVDEFYHAVCRVGGDKVQRLCGVQCIKETDTGTEQGGNEGEAQAVDEVVVQKLLGNGCTAADPDVFATRFLQTLHKGCWRFVGEINAIV